MSGMEEVLTAHHVAAVSSTGDGKALVMCTCLHETEMDGSTELDYGDFAAVHAAHQAAVLTAAGFGPVKEAAAGALEEAADVLKKPRVLWWGGEGVFVAEESYAPPKGSIDHWLRARAAAVRGES